MKKRKISILTRIAFLFIAALLIAALCTNYLSYQYMIRMSEVQNEEVSNAAATAVLAAIGPDRSLDFLYENPEYRETMHEVFRFICQRINIRYLYMYTIDESGNRHYLVLAANSDEEDLRMQTEYGFGKGRDIPLFEAEKNVLNGSKEKDYEMVDNDYGEVCMYIFPIRDRDNNIEALIGVDYYIESIQSDAMKNLGSLLYVSLMIIAFTSVISLFLIRRSVFRPIVSLSQRMRSFARDRKESMDPYRREKPYEDEITEIEDAFEKMTKDISQYVHDIETLTREQLYTQTQLDVARGIQNGIVPQETSVRDDGFAVYGCVKAARDVGGDFYDVFRLDDGRVCIVIGDISGKGISAALFMAMVKTTIREKLIAGRSLEDTLNLANREICDSNPENMFATVFALTLQPESGVITFANAGHEEPLLLTAAPSCLKIKSGMALGLFEDSDITEERFILRDGEGILLYTDGVTEAINMEKEMYGMDRLRETALQEYLASACSYDPQLLIGRITESVEAYTHGMDQFDDITCLALVYRETGSDKRELLPEHKSFDEVKDRILFALGESDHTKTIILACEEIFTNIVNYSGAKRVSFRERRSGNAWLITFEDDGIAFDPVNAKSKSLEFENLDQGGMGIMLARMNSRDMIYSRIDDKNVLMMVFDVEDENVNKVSA